MKISNNSNNNNNVIIALARCFFFFFSYANDHMCCDLANDIRVWIGSSLMIFITRWLTNNKKSPKQIEKMTFYWYRSVWLLCNQVWVFRTESTNLDDIIWFNLVEGVCIGYRWREPFDEKGRILRLIDV